MAAGTRVSHMSWFQRASGGVAIALVLQILVVPVAHAAAGDLDLTFGGGDGMVATPIGAGFDGGNAVVLQPSDNKIVMAGYSHNGSNKDFALVRYNSDGTLDTSFSGDGKVTTAIGSSEDEALGMAIQSDGKIVVAGYMFNGKDDDFGVARFTTSGTLDSTFGSGGKLVLPVGSSDEGATSVALQPDGKILVAGYTFDGSTENFAVVRLTTTGTLDATFDGDGKAITPVGSGDEQIYALTLQSDGKIVAAGDSYNGPYDDFALVRYNSNGTLDSTFGTGGKVVTPISSGLDGAYAVKQQPDGKLAVAGYAEVGGKFDFALARYNPSGTLDTTFGAGGKVTTALGSDHDEASGLAIQSDGRLVAAGYSIISGSRDFAVARYNPNGSLDTTFSGDGKLTNPIGAGAELAWGVVLQPDGKIVAAGQSSGGWNDDFAVVRYQGGGSVSPPPSPSLTVADTAITEGDSPVNATFTVTLSAAATQTVSLSYATANNSATAPADYTAASGTLSFISGETTKTVTVPVVGDLLDEPNESFYLDLSAPTNATIADGRGIATIIDNDPTSPPPSGTPSLTITDTSVTEGDSGSINATFTVALSAASTQTVSLSYATANNSATAPADYTAASGPLSFGPGVVTKTVTVPVMGDLLDEANETFYLDLSAPTNATISDGRGVATIIDNDDPEPAPSGTHDVGVRRNGLRTDKQISLSRDGAGPHAVILTVQNFGTTGENITYHLTSTGSAVLSSACSGNVDNVAPGSSVSVRGCVVTYGGTGAVQLTLSVAHNNGDGGTDQRLSNNDTSLRISVKS